MSTDIISALNAIKAELKPTVKIGDTEIPMFNRVVCSEDLGMELKALKADELEPYHSFLGVMVEINRQLPEQTIVFKRGGEIVAVWSGGALGQGEAIEP